MYSAYSNDKIYVVLIRIKNKQKKNKKLLQRSKDKT